MFMEALATTPPVNSGEIDGKVFVCNYRFLTADRRSYDADQLDDFLASLHASEGCHVAARAHWAPVFADLFADETAKAAPANALVVECRIVKHVPLESSPAKLIEHIERGFESIPGVDGNLRWFERSEGSADYIRLLKEVPECLRVPEL